VSNEIIKYAFTGGEVSPTLFGRSDLEQYDLGLALAKNWFVDYRGGLSTRAGFEFCDFIMHDDLETKFFDFRFSPDLPNIYLILVGHNYIRFIQDGAYVLEAPKTITAFSGDTVTAAAHGYSVGDWVKVTEVVGLNNVNTRTFQVASVTTNTFTVLEVPTLTPFAASGAYVSGGNVSRIYTVESPWVSTQLEDLKVDQWRDLLRFTHPRYRIRNLTRIDDAEWTLSIENTAVSSSRVSGITAVASAAGDAGVLYCVTAVLEDGSETLMSVPFHLGDIVNYTVTEGFVTVNWNRFNGAQYYNVYRSTVASDGTKLTKGAELGYIGKAVGTQFIDSNIIPDFTKTPSVNKNPFVANSVEFIQVTDGGTGYSVNDTVTLTDGSGSGFVGFPIVDSTGAITAVKIISGGSDYANPTVVFSGGTGATATVTKSASEGFTPGVSTVFQQRQVYASTIQDPLTVWGSRPRRYSDFTYSELTLDNDSYEFEIDSKEVSPILHMIPTRGGLVLMSRAGIWQLSGGNSGVVTPTNALADPQTYTGVSKVGPIPIGTDILYNESKGFSVRLLSYNEFAKVYAGEDKSILSSHLFSSKKVITSWAFAENPYKIVHAVRSDGALLNFTFVKEEKVWAWTWGVTKGQFKDCKVIQEDNVDRLYVVVRRRINGRWTKFIERMSTREFSFVEDAFCVDAGLRLGHTYPAAMLTASATSGVATFTASAGVFSLGDVGKILRMGGGKAVVTEYLSSTEIKAEIVRPITDVLSEDPSNLVLEQASGTWTLDTPITSISGLWHLEGETVAILADGSVQNPKVVVGGGITLDTPATTVNIGLAYQAVAQTLPPVVSDAVIEARRKRVIGVATRVNDTVGLKTGRSLTSLYAAKERTNELWGEPIRMFSGVRTQLIDPEWNENGQTYFVQDNPLPATLLGIVFEIEVGDDSD
jgi:hypothetical protein